MIITIFFYRYFLVENPFYPLFSKFFNPENQQLLNWEKTLRGWERGGLFPLWIFIPKTIGKISFVLGPANLLLIMISIIYFLRNLISNNGILTVGIYQFILLMIFSQGRADYYMSPLILISLGLPGLKNRELKFLNIRLYFSQIFRRILTITFLAQLLMFLISALYSISSVRLIYRA